MRIASDADEISPRVCRWVGLSDALEHFAKYLGPPQSQQHIKPLHWRIECRLVLEGGFRPQQITPRPPFAVTTRGRWQHLTFDPKVATGGETTVLGGLKTKNVDVAVTKEGIGPVLGVSCKGMTGAFRNLTNRMEETIGECTNLHITYPALVLGCFFVIRANRASERVAELTTRGASPAARQLLANDVAIEAAGGPVQSIVRFHSALRELAGRRGIRSDGSRYEAIALAMVATTGDEEGAILPSFPPPDSPLRIEQFFKMLYLRYDERFVYGAPDLTSVAARLEWSPASEALMAGAGPAPDFEIRAAPEQHPMQFGQASPRKKSRSDNPHFRKSHDSALSQCWSRPHPARPE